MCNCVSWVVSTIGSASATTVGCGCLNAIFDLGGSESGRQGSVFRVSAMREGLEDWPSGQWGGRALLPSTTLGEDVIHGTEGESVSGVCHTMGGVLTCYGRRRCRQRGQQLANRTWRIFSNVVICNHAKVLKIFCLVSPSLSTTVMANRNEPPRDTDIVGAT